MKTPIELGELLLKTRKAKGRKISDLVEKTGLTAVTLRRAFDGQADSRLSTIFALANELGMELALVPKGFGDAMQAAKPTTSPPSAVHLALSRRSSAPGNQADARWDGWGQKSLKNDLYRQTGEAGFISHTDDRHSTEAHNVKKKVDK